MECKFFPQVSEIREMAGAHSQQLDLMDVDRAWFWINTYLKKHGVEGRDYVESESVEGHCPRCNDTRWITTEVNGERTASRCDCRRVTLREPAPAIAPRIKAALQCMAPTLELALEGLRDCEGKWAAKLRVEFNGAYRRAKALEVAI